MAASGDSASDLENEKIKITVSDPQKRGDGMGAYMVYRVTTKTSLSIFSQTEFSVFRRFSDFLGLHDKLVEKHLSDGYIIPPAPEKSVVGATKIKMSKDDYSTNSADFVEKRRAALERYLNRTAVHPELQQDPDFREFLELDAELPKATQTATLSGASVMRLLNKVGSAMGKITSRMEESEPWFEEKDMQIDQLDQHFRKLHFSAEVLVARRRELSATGAAFAKSCALLASTEEVTSLARALSQLSEVEEKIEEVTRSQAESDFFMFSELLKDYIGLLSAVKAVFAEREKCFRVWKDNESSLTKKREQKVKLELAHKPSEKIHAVEDEIRHFEEAVDKSRDQFMKISESIRKEMSAFEQRRIYDFKKAVIAYLEHLRNTQTQLIQHWEAFLPEAQAITS